jgi:ribosomal RNA-processing protein 1
LLTNVVHSHTDIRVPTSLAYHLSDIYIEELDKALATPPSSSPTPTSTPLPAPLSTLLTPFFSLAAHTPTNTTYLRIQSALFEPLFSALSPEDQPPSLKRIKLSSSPATAEYPNLVNNACVDDPKGEGKVEGSVLRKRLLRRVFEVASEPETRDSNRRKMYALWKDSVDENEDEDER